ASAGVEAPTASASKGRKKLCIAHLKRSLSPSFNRSRFVDLRCFSWRGHCPGRDAPHDDRAVLQPLWPERIKDLDTETDQWPSFLKKTTNCRLAEGSCFGEFKPLRQQRDGLPQTLAFAGPRSTRKP